MCKGYCASYGGAYCTSNGDATTHEVERLLHITYTGYYTSSGKDVKTADPAYLKYYSGTLKNYSQLHCIHLQWQL
jgi:hypothetical protein